MEQLKDPKLTLSDMYTKAEGKAKAWKADAVPARITNTSLGPLDEQGKSEAWNLMFYSPSANANVTINTFRGMFTCFAQAGTAGRLPDLKPTFARDGAKLYAIAKENGGTYIVQGYDVSYSYNYEGRRDDVPEFLRQGLGDDFWSEVWGVYAVRSEEGGRSQTRVPAT